ncbi:hypothetical protein [Azorhizobium doebereinerae]|uniref:hypothetical protein n=1 Tax=Azorhizobium doebereinerae TaxID=281091 RepID=UPI00041C85DA|nr:hypothetical protein [Azorhizobium doebereinerae]
MSVIPHDFGADALWAARRLRGQLGLDALHEANVRANPLPYLERASEQIYQLEKALFEAAEAGRGRPEGPSVGASVTIDVVEYDRLLACRAAVETALKALVTTPDEAGADA